MQAHRIETTVTEDGVVIVRNVPFRKGDSVEVIVLPAPTQVSSDSRYPLRGQPVVLIEPTEPVAEDEWEASR